MKSPLAPRFILSLGSVMMLGVLLSACTTSSPSSSAPTESAPGMTTQKSGDTTVTGTVTKMGDKYYIKPAGQPQQEVDSYSIDLSTYVDKKVSITGQFSGDTLFAGTIIEQ